MNNSQKYVHVEIRACLPFFRSSSFSTNIYFIELLRKGWNANPFYRSIAVLRHAVGNSIAGSVLRLPSSQVSSFFFSAKAIAQVRWKVKTRCGMCHRKKHSFVWLHGNNVFSFAVQKKKKFRYYQYRESVDWWPRFLSFSLCDNVSEVGGYWTG